MNDLNFLSYLNFVGISWPTVQLTVTKIQTVTDDVNRDDYDCKKKDFKRDLLWNVLREHDFKILIFC